MADLKATEWDLLEALWTLERATASQVTEHLGERRGWSYSTVKTLLDRMVKRELVHARLVGNVWEYQAAIRRDQARRGAWDRLVDLAFGGSLGDTLQFVAGQRDLTDKQRAALQALLDEDDDK